MEQEQLIRILEGALLAAGKPLSVGQLTDLFEEVERPKPVEVRDALKTISLRYTKSGFELREVANGFRFQIKSELGPWISRLWQERPQRYSRALLETLSLIAYRQPITRGEIEQIRGVSLSTSILRTLHEREWVRVIGHRDVPGRPALYATTGRFLDYFNLKSLDQLPALADVNTFDTLTQQLELETKTREDSPSVDLNLANSVNPVELSQANSDSGSEIIVNDLNNGEVLKEKDP